MGAVSGNRAGTWAWIAAVACAALACFLAAPGRAAAAPAWLPQAPISEAGRDAGSVQVEMDPAGNAVAVWQRQKATASGSVVQAAVRPAGGTFTAPVDLTSGGSEPSLSISPDGEAIVVWRELVATEEEVAEEQFLDTSRQTIRSTTWTAAAGFAPAATLYEAPPTVIQIVGSTPTVLEQGGEPQQLRTALDSAGNAVVAWEEKDPEEPSGFVMATTRAAGGAFAPGARISPAPEPEKPSGSPAVAIDEQGAATVVWHRRDGGVFEVEAAATTSPGGAFSGPQVLNGALGAEEQAVSPDVGVDAAGDTTAVWRRVKGEDSSIEASYRPAGGGFGEPGPISAGDDRTFAPEIEVAPDGTSLAVWLEGGPPTLVRVAAGGGGAFAGPVALGAGGDASAQSFDAVLAPSGAAGVAWASIDKGIVTVLASVRAAGGGFGPVQPASAAGTQFLRPDLGIDSFGDLSAVWAQATDGGSDLAQAAGYDAFAPQLRELAVPAGGRVGETLRFSVAPFDVWPLAQAASFAFGDGSVATGNTVDHAYAAPGTYEVVVSATDGVGTATEQRRTLRILPRSGFRLGKLVLDRKTGTAKLPVTVEEAGAVAVRGRGVKTARTRTPAPGKLMLRIKAVGKAKKTLIATGRSKLSLTVDFTPRGGVASLKKTKGTLRKKLP